MVCRVSEKCL